MRLVCCPAIWVALLIPTFVSAQDPTPTPPSPTPVPPLSIEGERQIPAYRLVELRLAGPAVDDAEWDVMLASEPALDIQVREINSNGTAVHFVGPPGSYRVVAWVTIAGRMGKAVASVTIAAPPNPNPPNPGPGPNPNPDPNPPTPVPERYGMVTLLRPLVVLMPASERSALAGQYTAIASMAAAGAFKDVNAMQAAQREANRTTLGARLDAWKPVLDTIPPKLLTLWNSGQAKSLNQFQEVWAEIAMGVAP